MLERQLLLCFVRPKADMELCPVDAKWFERDYLGQSVLNSSPSLVVNALSLVTNLQRPLERCRAIIAQEDVDRLFPFA